MREQSLVDGLTGLINRRGLYAAVTRELSAATREQSSVSVLLLDLNGFKAINDTHGHRAGDDLLRSVSTLLIGSVRACDTVARLGGDEFVVVLPRSGREAALVVAQRITDALAACATPDGQGVRAAVGIATASDASPPSVDELLHRADQSMYAIKFEQHAARKAVGA